MMYDTHLYEILYIGVQWDYKKCKHIKLSVEKSIQDQKPLNQWAYSFSS